MTANRAEQKGSGSMGITTAEQRAALEKAGWRVAGTPAYETWDYGAVQVTLSADGDHRLSDLFQRLSEPGALARLMEFAAILGMAPPGYVMVPVDTFSTLLGTAEEYVKAEASMGNDTPSTAAAIEAGRRLFPG